MFGINNFDNLFESMITIFQVITMEGWTDIMYMIMDTNGNPLTVPFFCAIIIIGSFFLLNLILAVIMRVFTQNDELEKIKHRQRKIIEDTKKLRKNPKPYLIPLKVQQIQRPKSAIYRKKYEQFVMEHEFLEKEVKFEENKSEQNSPKSDAKQTDSNFLNLQSLKTKDKFQNSSSNIKNQPDRMINLFDFKVRFCVFIV